MQVAGMTRHLTIDWLEGLLDRIGSTQSSPQPAQRVWDSFSEGAARGTSFPILNAWRLKSFGRLDPSPPTSSPVLRLLIHTAKRRLGCEVLGSWKYITKNCSS